MYSYRRKFLDGLLIKYKNLISGRVLDIGGKKKNKRGLFNPNLTNQNSWEYLNVDDSTNPDFLASVYNMPLSNSVIDTVVFCEVLEYLKEPYLAMKEIKRILRKDGHIIGSVPFMSPVHGDSNFDKLRYTKSGLVELFESINFEIITLEEMGSTSNVIYDILRIQFSYYKNFSSKFLSKILNFTRPIFSLFESSKNHYVNTGYFFILKKID